MSVFGKALSLFIPNKTQNPVKQPSYGTDMRAIEAWAKNVIVQLEAGSGITLTPSSGVGPVVTISASGGGGGVTTITSSAGSIAITNPTGPTTNLEVANRPFLPYADGLFNVGYGPSVLANITTGDFNTAVGTGALNLDTSGSQNSAFGDDALSQVTTGANNAAIGNLAGQGVISSSRNTAVGAQALSTFGADNTECTALGYQSLLLANGSIENVAIGAASLSAVTTGQNNVSVGTGAGNHVTTGTFNTSCGDLAGVSAGNGTISYTTSVGASAHCDAAGGVAIGVDHLGTAADAVNQDDFVLGTVNHVVNFLNNQTGSTTTTLGTNGPSVSTTPTTWIKVRLHSGSIGYIPVWV